MKKNDEVLLTIVIPTYNRNTILDANLQNLHNLSLYFEFELVVCNNASTDCTDAIVDKWKNRINRMHVINQPFNIYFDRNVATGYMHVNTPYCWVLGDANTVDASNLERVLTVLCERRPQAIVVNDPLNSVQLEDKHYSDVNILFREIGWYTTLLCSCIICRDFITKERCQRYYDSGFVHEGVFFDYLSTVEKIDVCLMSSVHISSIQAGNKNSTGWKKTPFLVFGKRWFAFIMSLPYKYSIEDKFHCIKQHDKHQHVFSPWNLLKLRISGICSYEDFRDAYPILKYVVDTPIFLVYLIGWIPPMPWLYYHIKNIFKRYK